ncbi:unnamed protein product [Auanema sp. JU1783]|nr:unnamed protein product [Auanema sp. JU1783]
MGCLIEWKQRGARARQVRPTPRADWQLRPIGKHASLKKRKEKSSVDPEICLSYVGMLVTHFNSHVRYGAVMALGIACAGSGFTEAIALLQPLISAKENFVRQGAIIALSFILVQQTEATCPKVSEYRKAINKIITEKGEETLAKFGAFIAQGILDAGGRNLTISLHNRTGHPDMGGVVGMLCFQQYWYWHSMVDFISLATKPTCLIALNKNLAMPKMEFKCNAKASMFAYPPILESKKKEEQEKVETAVLSITNKKKLQKAAKEGVREAAREAAKEAVKEEKMDVDHPEETKEKKDDDKKTEVEPSFHSIENPCRVVRLQLKTLSMPENARYKPVKAINQGGIILVRDRKPNETEELVAQVVAGGTTTDPAAPEKEPHSTFEIDLSEY